MHESGGIFLKGHFGGSFFGSFCWVIFGGHFWGSFLGSFLGVRCCFTKVLSRNLKEFARNRCVHHFYTALTKFQCSPQEARHQHGRGAATLPVVSPLTGLGPAPLEICLPVFQSICYTFTYKPPEGAEVCQVECDIFTELLLNCFKTLIDQGENC